METLKAYLVTLVDFLRHKWRVLRLCAKQGLWWQGIIHDLSKLSPLEFQALIRLQGAAKPSALEKAHGDHALLRHYQRNPHHWQHWIDPNTGEGLQVPKRYLVEMICDWASFDMNNPGYALKHYCENRETIKLHPASRKQLEILLGYNAPIHDDKHSAII